jgi:tight adherence protein C
VAWGGAAVTGLQLAILGGMLIAAGVVAAVRALNPAPPGLAAALQQLSADPARPTTTSTGGGFGSVSGDGRWAWLPVPVAELLEAHVGVSDQDLAVLGWTRSQLAARKLTLALAGLLTPSVIGLLMLLLGLGSYVVFPAALALGLAAVGWLLPSQEARELAGTARAEFRTNLEFFLTLVAGERRARGSVEQALEEAAAISGSSPFVAMRRAIRRAALSGRKPWADLRALGDELDVPELRNLADIAEIAADGAAVYATLLTTARTLRHAELSDQRTEANQISERMSRPLALLVFGLTLFVLVPFMLRMFGIT